MTRHVWKFKKERSFKMKAWFKKFLLLFWPWSKIDELERALTAQNQMLIAANDRYNNAWQTQTGITVLSRLGTGKSS